MSVRFRTPAGGIVTIPGPLDELVAAAPWIEARHPRHPAGSSEGGEFSRKGGGVTRDESEAEGQIRDYVTELYDTLAQRHPDTYPYVQAEVDKQIDYMMGNYREAYEPAFSALEERLAGIPGVRLEPRLYKEKIEALAEVGPHTGDIMVKFDVPEGQLDPDFGVWFMPPMEGEEFPPNSVRVPGGALELHDVLDISDTDFFPPDAPDLAGRYADALDDVRGIKREGYITLHRGMSAAEADAWIRGEEIPTGKFFTSSHTSAMAQDIAGEFPELYSWKVAQRDVIETEPGVFQLRRPARLKDKTIESLAGAGFLPIPLEPPPPINVAQFNRATAQAHEEIQAFEPRLTYQYEAIIRRLGRQIARRFTELATETPALAAAAWDETQHPRDPGGEGGGQFIEKGVTLTNDSSEPVHPNFPRGIYDMDDSVVFWPQEIGSDPERHGEPLWKAFVDENGNEVAFWFADDRGRPHHDDMLELWDKTGGPTNTDSFYGSSIAGYGDEVDLHEWRSMDVAQQAELDADEIYNLAADEDWHTIYDKYGLIGADVDGLEKADIQEMLNEQYLDRFKAVPRRHRKDIKDARAMFGDLTAAAEPAAWNPPTVAELVAKLLEDAITVLAGPTATQRKAFSKVVDGILRQLGLSFDVRSIIAQTILNGLAARSEGILEGIRVPVARIVANSWLNGLSVPQTADALMEGVDGLADWQATQLARNDLVGMANGGSLLAAKMVNAKFPGAAGSYKQWLATDDERTRPTHNEAHGQRVPLETPFIVGGAPLEYPGDPSGPDGEVINCRCTLIYFSEPKAGLTAAFVEQEHPRDPGGDAGGEFIKKGTTGADEGATAPASTNIPEAAGETLDEMLRNIGAMELEMGELNNPERYMKHPKSGWMVEKPGFVYPESMPPPEGGASPPRIRDVVHGEGFAAPEGIENVKPLGYGKYQVGEPRPPEHLFRAISEAEWIGIQERGYIQSDQRMNLSQEEGTVTAFSNPSYYLPGALASDKPGRYEGRIIRIKYRDEDGWRHDDDDYVKTMQPIPISQIDMVTPKLKREVTPRPGKDWNDIGPVIRASAVFVEEEHPRDPGGEGGGQFIEKGTTAEGGFPATANGVRPSADQIDRSEDMWNAKWDDDTMRVVAARNELPDEDAYIAAVEAKAKEDLFNAEVTIRTPIDLVDEVAEDWRFKSQFETQTSRGSLDNELRAYSEESLFQYPADTPAEERPIYGYMDHPNRNDSWTHPYGEAKWELKRDVRPRTTFTQGDSLSMVHAPSPIDNPSYLSITSPSVSGNPANDTDVLRSEVGIWTDVPYVEAQIHGGVKMDDVAALILPKHFQSIVERGHSELPSINPHAADEDRLIKAVQKLKHFGVTVEYEGPDEEPDWQDYGGG